MAKMLYVSFFFWWMNKCSPFKSRCRTHNSKVRDKESPLPLAAISCIAHTSVVGCISNYHNADPLQFIIECRISVWWHGDPNWPRGLIQTWGCRSHKPGSITSRDVPVPISNSRPMILDMNPIENQFVFIPAKDPIPYPVLYPIVSCILSHVPYPILLYPISYCIPSHILSSVSSYVRNLFTKKAVFKHKKRIKRTLLV